MKLGLNINTFLKLFFIISGILILSHHYIKYRKLEALLIEREITTGKVIYFGYSAGGAGAPAEYVYKIGNNKITSTFYGVDFCRKVPEHFQEEFTKYQFPVIYYPDNPEINKILLKVEDYHKYNIPIPDSLAEVLVYYFNCDYKVIRPEGKPAQIIKK